MGLLDGLDEDELKELVFRKRPSNAGGGVLASPFMQLLGASADQAGTSRQEIPSADESQTAFAQACKAFVPDPAYRKEFLDNLNRLSTDQFRFNDAGFVEPTGESITGGRHSPDYARGMNATIDAAGTATFHKGAEYPSTQQNGQVIMSSVDGRRGGGVTIFDGRGNADVYLSGAPNRVPALNGPDIWMEPDETQEHEITLHAGTINPNYLPDGVTRDEFENGSAIPFENRMRMRQGFKPRAYEQAHGFKEDHAQRKGKPR